MRSKEIFSLAIVFTQSFSMASPFHQPQVLYQSLGANNSDYIAYLKSEENLVSPLESQLDLPTKIELKNSLKQTLQSAQTKFLEGNATAAKNEFSTLSSFALLADWKTSERRPIHYALLRLAQLSPESAAKNNYVNQALEFDREILPDRKLFPPPLVQKYFQLKKGMSQTVWVPNKNYSGFSSALINGKRVSFYNGESVRLPNTKIRITLLSNKLQPVTKIIHSGELNEWKPSKTAWVAGSCQNPKLKARVTNNTNGIAYFSENCVKSKNLGLIGGLGKLRNSHQTQSPRKTKLPDFSTVTSTKEKRSFLKNKWLWIGLGAIATAAAVNQHSQSGQGSKTKVKPVHR